MAANRTRVKFKRNVAGIRALRNTPEIQADLERRARNVAAKAEQGLTITPDGQPAGMLTDSHTTGGAKARWRTSVRTVGPDAVRAEATDRALTRAFTTEVRK